MSMLKDVLPGFMNGQKDEKEGGNSGSAGAIHKLNCHHLKRWAHRNLKGDK